MLDWRPTAGQVALIEPSGAAHDDCLTGVVLESDRDDVVVDIGTSRPSTGPAGEVTASFFSPDALYRIEATLSRHNGAGTVIDLAIHDIERVQRRVSPRVKVEVPVVLSNFDDTDPDGGEVFASVTGHSVDIGEGGCRVSVSRRFPSGCDPTVSLRLSPVETLVALAAVLEEAPQPDGTYEYRLVFTDDEDGHREALGKVMASA